MNVMRISPKGKLFLFFILILLQFSAAFAINIEFSSIKYENEKITVKLAARDSLPDNIIGYIKKGVPITFDYKIELWKSRAGWIDKLKGNTGVEYRLRYDSWEKQYTIISQEPELTVEHTLGKEREAIEVILTTGRLSIPLKQTEGQFYIVGKLTIKTMSFSNFMEVESWLKGEISGAGKPKLKSAPNKFGEFIFNTALKISGLKNISEETRTSTFEIKDRAVIFPASDKINH